MIIGVPREIKTEEYRVALTPDGVRELKKHGHTVLVEHDAGAGSGFKDNAYLEADADLVDKASLFRSAELILKVKEPLSEEFGFFREAQTLFTYLHLAPNAQLTDFLLEKRITGLAYETLEKDGGLPLLAPMSEIAGRMAPLMGSYFLQAPHGGTGVLPTGLAGVKPAVCVVLGAGVVGANAARVASGIGMDTVVLNRGIERLRRIDELSGGSIRTLPLTSSNIAREIRHADIVIGSLLVTGGRTPVVITREMLSFMKQGCVLVDVSIDQGGCAETSRPATHNEPVYTVDGVVHYTVANMPGAYPRSSTLALTNATLAYVVQLADQGISRSLEADAELRTSLNTHEGKIVHKGLLRSLAEDRGR